MFNVEIIKLKEGKEIKLDQFLKWVGEADTGGVAKIFIKEGRISLNGEKAFLRNRALKEGDIIDTGIKKYMVTYKD